MDTILPDSEMPARAERMALEILARPEEQQAETALYAVLAYRETLAEEFPGQPPELIDRTARAFAKILANTIETIGLSGGSAKGNA